MSYANGVRCLHSMAVLIALGLAGCSTASFQTSDPAYKMQSAPAVLSTRASGSARVAVRWTQIVTPAAQSLLEANWVPRHNDVIYGNSISLDGSNTLPAAHQSMAADSAYYAAEFTRLLGRRIPAADIVMEPLALDAQDGKFVYKPLVRNRFPAQLVVDLWTVPRTHFSPHPYATIVYSIATSGLASPATCGVLGFKPSRNVMPAFDKANCVQSEARDVPRPDLIHGFEGKESAFATPLPLKQGVPLQPGLAVAFPQTYEEFTAQYLETSGATGFDAQKNLFNPTLEELSKVVADGLSRIDARSAVLPGWSSYVAIYDAPLAQRLQTGAEQSNDAEKLRFITRLADAERAWVTAQDEAVLKTLLDGNFGKSFRATRFALDQAQTRQTMMSMASMFAMVGTMGAASALGSAGSSVAAMQANMAAMQIAAQSLSDQQQSSDAFYRQFGSELAARQQVAEIDVGGKVIQVQADNLNKLYAELDLIYQSRFTPGRKGEGQPVPASVPVSKTKNKRP